MRTAFFIICFLAICFFAFLNYDMPRKRKIKAKLSNNRVVCDCAGKMDTTQVSSEKYNSLQVGGSVDFTITQNALFQITTLR